MKLEIASDDRCHAILVCDEHHNDIAEFFHNEHATVGQSYETALALAKQLVEGCGVPAQKAVNRDETDHIDWDILAEERLGQRPRSEHGRHIPQTSPAPGCDSGSHSAQGAKEPTVDELGGYIEHGLCYGISSKDGRIAARSLLAQFDIRAKALAIPSTNCGSGE